MGGRGPGVVLRGFRSLDGGLEGVVVVVVLSRVVRI